MKKLTFSMNALWITAILLSALPAQGMEQNSVQVTLQAKEYNDNECFLIKLPNEILPCIQSLMDNIKFFMTLNTTCKKFNKLLTLEAIGKRCKDYDLIHKNKTLANLIRQFDRNEKNAHPSTLVYVLLYAEADANIACGMQSVLEIAIRKNSEELVAILLEYGADPNVISIYCPNSPIFFEARTIRMAQMLIDNGADLRATNIYKTNVLNHMLHNYYSPELMQLYLQHNADATQLNPYKDCFLHQLGRMYFIVNKKDIENTLEKGKLLLNSIPHMINTLNNDGKTPLDATQDAFYEEIKTINQWCYTGDKPERKASAYKDLEKLIEFFRSHQGLTAQELAQKEKQSQLTHK